MSKKIGILVEKDKALQKFKIAFGGVSGTYKGTPFVLAKTSGHAYQFKEPHLMVEKSKQSKYKSWAVSNIPWDYKDFKWKYDVIPTARKMVDNIYDSFKDCDEIVIATDIDPSGEGFLLAAEILQNTKLDKKKLSRMFFVDETAPSLQKAFAERKSLDKLENHYEYQMAFFRARWDFISMQHTRLATKISGSKTVLRNGRLKSTMVDFVARALEDLEKYEEIPFYQNKFKDENGIIYTNSKEPIYENKEDVPKSYKDSKVILSKTTRKSTKPPLLMDLAQLGGVLSSRGIGSKEVLTTYQKLYEADIVSYPRVEDKNITFEQFNELLPLVDSIANLVGVDTKLLTVRKPRPTHVMDKGSHGANRPGLVVPKSLEELSKYGRAAKHIYTTLAKNFLAMFGEDYIYDNQSGYLEDYPNFKGSTNVPVSLGWKAVYQTDDEEEETSKGLGTIAKPFIHTGYPPKPPYPTQRWLTKKLANNDVGTGATRLNTYSEITSKTSKTSLLSEEKGGRLNLTDVGFINKQIIRDTNIADVKVSEMVINAMKVISQGNYEIADKILNEFQDLVLKDLEIMRKNRANLKFPSYEKKEKHSVETEDGKTLEFNKTWGGHTFTEEEVEKLINGETIEIRGLKNKRGKEYGVRGRLEEQIYKGRKFFGFKMLEFI